MSSELNRVPPHSLEAEQSVLGCMLLSRDAAQDILAKLRPAHFYRDIHARIFAACVGMDTGIDLVSLTESLRARGDLEACGGPEYLCTLQDSVPTWRNAETYADIVLAHAKLRDLLDAAGSIQQLAYGHNGDIRKTLDAAEAAVYAVTEDRGDGDLVDIADELFFALADIDARRGKDPEALGCFPTGLHTLDRRIHGLYRGQLFVLAARPSIGKTTFALNMARGIAERGAKVAFFSLEMTRRSLIEKLMCMEAGIDSDCARAGTVSADDISGPLGDAANLLSTRAISIDEMPGQTPLEVRGKARRKQSRDGLDVAIVDHLHLMEPSERGEREDITIGLTTRALKATAKLLGINVLLLCQLNRNAEGRPPTLADLRNSGRIEEDADVVAFLHRDRDFDNMSEDTTGDTDVIIAKQREGWTGTLQFAYQRHTGRFIDKAPAWRTEEVA